MPKAQSALSDGPASLTPLETRPLFGNTVHNTEVILKPWAAQSYATLHVLANAIKTAQSADPAAIRDALAQTTDYPTILGRLDHFSFNSDGDALYDQILVVVKDGEIEFLE